MSSGRKSLKGNDSPGRSPTLTFRVGPETSDEIWAIMDWLRKSNILGHLPSQAEAIRFAICSVANQIHLNEQQEKERGEREVNPASDPGNVAGDGGS